MMRLDKLLAHTGFGTRKEVRQIIKDEYIKVNGEVVTKHGTKVDPEKDDVRFGGQRVYYQEFVYFMLNKPAGVVSATEDFVNETVLDLLEPADLVQDPHLVGRLDKDTEGLLILTNDGKLTHQLISPKKEVDKEYYARIDGMVTEEDVAQFEEGLTLEDPDEDIETMPAQLNILEVNEDEETSEITVVLHEGKFHQVKRMFEAVGKKVMYLKRIRMGELELDEALPLGEYRPLTETEIEKLRP